MSMVDIQPRARKRRTSASSHASGQRDASSSIADTVKTAEHEVAHLLRRTVTWSQLEEWQKDNEFIINGYRRAQNSWRGCACSILGYLHNETVNIHSHLLGAFLFLALLCVNNSAVVSSYPTTTWVDTAMISVFLCSAVFCLSSSSIFHIMVCHSKHVFSKCHMLDYSGIIALILGSFFPSIYYGFYCDPLSQHVYLICMSFAGAGAAFIVLSPEYSKPTHRGARTKVFIALGISAVLPVSHALLTHGVYRLRYEMGLDWLVLSGVLYIFGALLYANRIPERFSPGTFDYFFASHQIFHVMVVLAALAHYRCVLKDLEYWHGRYGGTCPGS